VKAIYLTRLSDPMRQPKSVRNAVKQFLTGVFGGADNASQKTWLRFWNRVSKLEIGEVIELRFAQPRSGAFHRRHWAIMSSVFDAQEQFTNQEQFNNWVKIGCGHCDWYAGESGAIPIPKSVSYAAQDQEEFEAFHSAAVEWLQSPYPKNYLWPHLTGRAQNDMMEICLSGEQ
jgi:hypothetical protein